MTQPQEWGWALHQRIAKAIRKAREGRMSAQELADETERLGYPVSRSQIANYESGRKQSLDVAELLVLAAALNIPPGLLLFPGYPSGEAEFLPGRTADTKAALDWFSGAGRLPTEGPWDAGKDAATINAGTQLVELVRRFDDVARAFMYTQQGLSLMMANDPAADRSFPERQMREFEKSLVELRGQIDELAPTFEIMEKPR